MCVSTSENTPTKSESSTEKRIMCHNCPWGNNYPHKEGWADMVSKGIESGEIKSKVHRCHEIDNDTWDETNDLNVSDFY